MSADIFIVSLGALISHEKFQHDSSTLSWSKGAGYSDRVMSVLQEEFAQLKL